MSGLLRRFWIILIIFFFFKVPVIADDTNIYFPGDTLRASTPESQGMDSEYLVKMLDYIQSNKLDIHSILIIRHGYVVMEVYKEPFGKDVIHIIQSTTKSFTSALVGIALKEGYIKSIDQKVVDIFSGLKIQNMDDDKRQITIKHLLSMNSGITWNQSNGGPASYYKSSDWSECKHRLRFS